MIQDYASLQAAIGNWLNKSADANLTVRIPEFIQLAEAALKRKLDDTAQEVVTTLTITNGIATLPADFGGLIDIDGDFNDDPINYNIVGSQIQTDPVETGTLNITYRQTLPSLSDTNTANWLLNSSPDIYLFASLLQAEFYGWNDERLPLIKAAYDEMLADLAVDSEKRRFGDTPISPQLGRT